jgi:hypothetical protein
MYATNEADLKAEQQYRANQTKPQPQCDNAHVSAGCEPFGRGFAPDVQECNPEPLLWRLQREADSYGGQAAKKRRAVELLRMHPEFEDLIELLRIVNLY